MSTSKCKLCGEEIIKTGNYTIKIHPSKRVPKKAKKIITERNKQDDSFLRLTKFQKYLQRCTIQRNFIEITCGNCGGCTKISMSKPKLMPNANATSVKGTPTCIGEFNESLQGSSRKRKKKSTTPKDLNAGLTIPPMLSTPRLNKTCDRQNSALSHNFNNKKEKFHKQGGIPSIRKISFKDKNVTKSQARVIEQKEMSKLKTALFKSNEDSKKSAPSLLNFFN